MNANIYRNKEMKDQITFGRCDVVGWQWKDGDDSENGTKEEMIFSGELGTWITMEIYRERKAERVRQNRLFYFLNPRLLHEKKRIRQGRVRILHVTHPYRFP